MEAETVASRPTSTIAVLAGMSLLLALFAAPASAQSAVVTSGSFEVFASGPGSGYDQVVGTARMERDKETEVEVEIERGLVPGAIYDAHVHDEPCDQNDANGHYFFDQRVPDGDGPEENEIWPGPFTANPAGGAEGKTKVGATAGADAVSVVVHASSGAKIACADLD